MQSTRAARLRLASGCVCRLASSHDRIGFSAPIRRSWAGGSCVCFGPIAASLAVIVAMILVTSLLSVIGALLVRRVFDDALFVRGGPDLGALYPLVAALIAIPIVNGVLNVAQAYLTEVVGNRVLQELRDRLFEHLERLSLAFYTATRSGEVQSRLANDVGGVQTTITSTASSVVSNVVTLVSSVVAMLVLSPLLTAISLAATPVFVLFSRRVGRARRKRSRRCPGFAGGDGLDHPGDPVGVRDPAGQGLWAPGARGRPLPRRERQPGRPADPTGDSRAIVLRGHPGVLRDQSGAGVSRRRASGHSRRPLGGDVGGIHDPAEPAADPDQPVAAGVGRRSVIAGAVRRGSSS